MDIKQIERARTALDNMDDFARMSCGVDPIGPRKVLEDFIAAACYADPLYQAMQDFRADVLSGIDGLDNDQINAVLGTFDNYMLDEPAAAAGAAEVSAVCPQCNGTGVVSDGEIDHYQDGTPYMHGPVVCVKDCPACKPKASFSDHIRWVIGTHGQGLSAFDAAVANMRAWHDQEVKDALAAQMAAIKQATGHDQDEFNRKWKEQRDRAEVAEAALALVKSSGHCAEGDKCVCGGDLPSIREGCGNWMK